MDHPQHRPRGFAAMPPEKRRAIASAGGKSVPAEKRSYSRNRDLAAEAGRKGGQNTPDARRSFFQDRPLAAKAGKKGGHNGPRHVLPHLRTDKAVLCPPHIAPAFTRLCFRPPMAWAENALAFRTVARSRRGNRAGGSWAATIWIATLLRPEWISRLET